MNRLEAALQYLQPKDNYEIKDSPIHGKGAFAKQAFKKGEMINPCAMDLVRINSFGKMLNHSKNPSCEIQKDEVFNVYALRNIDPGEELTVNYWDTPFKKPNPNWD